MCTASVSRCVFCHHSVFSHVTFLCVFISNLCYLKSSCSFLSIQASALAQECSHFLAKVEQRCYSASTLSTLQMYEERLGGEFSTLHFQAVKAKACAVGAGAMGVMKVWNAARLRCQQVRQHLNEVQKKKKALDKKQIQKTAAAKLQPEDGGVEKKDRGSEVGKGEFSVTQQEVRLSESEGENTTAACFHQYMKPDLKEKVESTAQNLPHTSGQNPFFPQNNNCHPESKWRPREHHSEADLRSADSVEGGDNFPSHQTLGRSLSERSDVGFQLTSAYGFLPLNVRDKHCPSRTQPLEVTLQPVKNLPVSHIESFRLGTQNCVSKSDSNEKECEGHAASTEGPHYLRISDTVLFPAEDIGSTVL